MDADRSEGRARGWTVVGPKATEDSFGRSQAAAVHTTSVKINVQAFYKLFCFAVLRSEKEFKQQAIKSNFFLNEMAMFRQKYIKIEK